MNNYLFTQYIRDFSEEGKSTFGTIIEFKLVQHLRDVDGEEKRKYNISHSQYIKEVSKGKKPPKGNEIDVLLEDKGDDVHGRYYELHRKIEGEPRNKYRKPISGKFIPAELKPYERLLISDFTRSSTFYQFSEQMRLIKEEWNVIPKEVRYYTHSFNNGNVVKQTNDQWQETLRNNIQKMKEKVRLHFGDNIPLKVYLISFPFPFSSKHNSFVRLLQKKLNIRQIYPQ